MPADAVCTVLDYPEKQPENGQMAAEREGYSIHMIGADMAKALPLADDTFD